jgi:DNA polymerase IV
MENLHPSWLCRKIVHIDMDCFFAAVEILDAPDLRHRPVIVGGPAHRGVVCAASYEARAFGVKSAMPMVTARQLCPKAAVIPPRIDRYREVSQHIHEIFQRYTDLIQPISLDEAFLDVTINKKKISYASTIAKHIKQDIQSELGLIASAGVAPNRFLAKIASDVNKPNGLKVIRPHEIPEFIRKLPIRRIWGVGPAMEKKLLDLGAHFASDLQFYELELLEKMFGRMGHSLYHLCRGIDESPVKIPSTPKSISRETTFSEDSSDIDFLLEKCRPMCKTIMDKLIRKNLYPDSLSLKLKTHDFQVFTRSITPQEAISSEHDLWGHLCRLLKKMDHQQLKFRLVGLCVQRLRPYQWEAQEAAPFQWLTPK